MLNQNILYSLFPDNPELPHEVCRFCKSLPEYLDAEREYNQFAAGLEQLLGYEQYSRFEALLNRYWAVEVKAYYLFGLGLRQALLRELGPAL